MMNIMPERSGKLDSIIYASFAVMFVCLIVCLICGILGYYQGQNFGIVSTQDFMYQFATGFFNSPAFAPMIGAVFVGVIATTIKTLICTVKL